MALEALLEVLEAHQFLQLPRLSSQEIFDQLCPPVSSKVRKRLCVVLISTNNGKISLMIYTCLLFYNIFFFNFSGDPKEELRRQALRSFLADHKFSPERVRFTYIFSDVQQFFVQALKKFSDKNDDNLAIIWRTDEYNLKFEWLSRYVSF